MTGAYPANNAYSIVTVQEDCTVVVKGFANATSATAEGPLGCDLSPEGQLREARNRARNRSVARPEDPRIAKEPFAQQAVVTVSSSGGGGGMNVTLINKTPLRLQVYSVDPNTHKTHATICELESPFQSVDSGPFIHSYSNCSVGEDFIVVHETGLERGNPFAEWWGDDSWRQATSTLAVVLDPAHKNYLKYSKP